MDEAGARALIHLSEGDMRRTLNLLQAVTMSAPAVTEEAVYACAGKPLPSDIEAAANWLLNESLPEAFERMVGLQRNKGVALVDILLMLHPYVAW